MAVLAKVGTLHEHLPSVLVDPCLYYCCTMHQALAALRSLCTEGCARTVRSTCVGVRNVIREFIWTAATVLCAHIRTGFFDAYCIECRAGWLNSTLISYQVLTKKTQCMCIYLSNRTRYQTSDCSLEFSMNRSIRFVEFRPKNYMLAPILHVQAICFNHPHIIEIATTISDTCT